MVGRFTQHYTPEEARALLPQVRAWLGRLRVLREELFALDETVGSELLQGVDVGGTDVNRLVRLWAESRQVLGQFLRREIEIKDLDRGLIDFPARREGREVFLCWEEGEADIQFWHDLEAGYAGRSPL